MKINNKKGFMLAELVVYISILAVISVLVIGFILTMIKSFGRIKVAQLVDDSARNSLERISNEIRFAGSIRVASSTLGTNPGVLVLNTNNRTTGATTTLEFSLNNSMLRIKEGSSAYENLTSSSTEVTNLIFRRIVSTSTQEAVKIEMTLKATKGGIEKTSNFYDTIILRKAY